MRKSLRKVGVARGDCVTLCSAGVPEAVYVVLACSRIGAIANFINPLFTEEQMVDRINETGAGWIFVLDEMYSLIEKVVPRICIEKLVVIPATNSIPPIAAKTAYLKSKARAILAGRGNHPKEHLSWSEFMKMGRGHAGDLDSPYEPNTPAVMVYSSGTTGASKGILLTNEGMNATLAYYGHSGTRLFRNDSFLQIIPVWFSTGIVLSTLMPLAHGVTVIPEPSFGNENFVNDLLKHRPSMTLAATNMWLYAIDAEAMRDADLSNMRFPITGGEKVLPADEERLNQFLSGHGCKSKLYKGYGMCEFGSTITGTTYAPGYTDKPGGCGYPILNSVVSVFDVDTNEELRYGEHGEIRAVSSARMKEYYKNPEATASFFMQDSHGREWGRTGDIGYIDRDGEVFILGRANDCYQNGSGKTVFLFDVESVILKEDAVDQCKVVGVEGDGETRLVAHIVFRKATGKVEELLVAIRNRIAEELPVYMQPSYYKVRESMPVNSNGKRDILALRGDREGLVDADRLQ